MCKLCYADLIPHCADNAQLVLANIDGYSRLSFQAGAIVGCNPEDIKHVIALQGDALGT